MTWELLVAILKAFMWVGLGAIGLLIVVGLVGVFKWDDRKAERNDVGKGL